MQGYGARVVKKLSVLDPTYAVCRLNVQNSLPTWARQGPFFSMTQTSDELSVVCEQSLVPEGVKTERDWKILKVQGPLEFGLTGILSSIVGPLAQGGISIFTLSTFDTDYILLKKFDLEKACLLLKNAGFKIL